MERESDCKGDEAMSRRQLWRLANITLFMLTTLGLGMTLGDGSSLGFPLFLASLLAFAVSSSLESGSLLK